MALAGKVALVTGTYCCKLKSIKDCLKGLRTSRQSYDMCAGSTQGIGLGVLKGLAAAGADVVMHGLVSADEFERKTSEIQKEFGVGVDHSAADVRKPEEIRHAIPTIYGFALRIPPEV